VVLVAVKRGAAREKAKIGNDRALKQEKQNKKSIAAEVRDSFVICWTRREICKSVGKGFVIQCLGNQKNCIILKRKTQEH
jgi:phosphopantetheinyl transferase